VVSLSLSTCVNRLPIFSLDDLGRSFLPVKTNCPPKLDPERPSPPHSLPLFLPSSLGFSRRPHTRRIWPLLDRLPNLARRRLKGELKEQRGGSSGGLLEAGGGNRRGAGYVEAGKGGGTMLFWWKAAVVWWRAMPGAAPRWSGGG
jgi:hypothetical protein